MLSNVSIYRNPVKKEICPIFGRVEPNFWEKLNVDSKKS